VHNDLLLLRDHANDAARRPGGVNWDDSCATLRPEM
jgi:hypothetical protein